MNCLRRKITMPLVAMTLATTSIVSYAPTAYASALVVPSPRWSYITMISADMEVDDWNAAQISVICNSDIFDTNRLKVKCELQQLNGSWKTIKTWTEENDDSTISFDKEWAIAKNYSYRLRVTVSAYKDSKLLETVTENFDYGYYN